MQQKKNEIAKSSKKDWENTFQNKGIMFLLIQATKPLKTAGSFLKKIINAIETKCQQCFLYLQNLQQNSKLLY